MITTEAEAKTKWCPMARVNTLVTGVDYNETAVGGAACNRSPPNLMTELPNCLGSDCAVWNWIVAEDYQPERVGCCGLIYKPGF